MPPRWERLSVAPTLAGKLYFDAVLRPHRSLSAAAFGVMLIAVVAVNLAGAVVFWATGAYPVIGFLGLDVLALWLAFKLNYRAANAEERVRVAAECVHVAAVSVDGAEAHWSLNPVWARVARDSAGVQIHAGGGYMQLGAFLSPQERESFAVALDAALYRAKRGG